MVDPSPSRRRAGASGNIDLMLAIALLWVPIALQLVAAARQTWVPTADIALIELRSLDVPGDVPLVGVYSRLGFNHPGPILFFWNALPVHLLGPKGLLVSTAAVNALAVAGIAIVAKRRGGRTLLALATLFLLVFERGLAAQMLDAWNPYVTTLPFTLFLVAVWAVLCRDWKLLPVVVVTGTFVVQAHVGFVPLVGVAALAATIAAIVAWRREDVTGPTWRVVTLAAALLVVLWLPPIVQQVTGDPGNLTKIADNLRHPGKEPAGLEQATNAYVHNLGTSLVWASGVEPLEPFSAAVSGAPAWTLVPPLALFAAGAATTIRRRGRRSDDDDDAHDPDHADQVDGPAVTADALRLLTLVAAVALVGFVAITRIAGDAYAYLVRWTWSIGFLVWFSATWALLVGLRQDRLLDASEDGPRAGRPRTIAYAIGGALAALALVTTSITALTTPTPNEADGVAAANVTNQAIDQLRDRGPILMRFAGKDLAAIGQGLFAELDRRGIPVYGMNDTDFVIGASHTIGDRTPGAVVVVATKEAVPVHLSKGQEPIAYYDKMSEAERKEYDVLGKLAAEEYGDLVAQREVRRPLTPDERARVQQLAPNDVRAAVFLDPPPG